ncbi:YidH family protein [Niallia sp. NCCP-28]|uniref:YidH family protein n=1 Tax=Niallia sp. NCCP-28 TaxID=2934712 RepID=UPI00208A8030|nr:DUF202 domain-containing protein [Niallia sp. NCCP-28]GKU81967.1 hypothetical protein NCCP28_13630 [Niallia sp. NCCP-28]
MQRVDSKKPLQEESVKYAQQHLANERTYLAWMRTAVSIIGVGFLTTSLHFTIKLSTNPYINRLAIFLGIFACMIGFVIAIMSTVEYSRKRKYIQAGRFIPSNHSIIFVSIIICFLIFFIFMYLSLLLLM